MMNILLQAAFLDLGTEGNESWWIHEFWWAKQEKGRTNNSFSKTQKILHRRVLAAKAEFSSQEIRFEASELMQA